MKHSGNQLSRRGLLAGVGAAAVAPTILPNSVFGANAPSNRITLGCIGVGRMGRGDLQDSVGSGFEVLAVCDVDSWRLAEAKKLAEAKMGKTGVAAYKDYRELLERDDIDAVNVVTADHWHALPSIDAANAGKDVFLQKPLTYTIHEGRELCEAVRRNGRIFQTGSQQRSDQRFRLACQLVRNGYIGELQKIEAGVGLDRTCGVQPVQPVPEELDYELWLGPAPWRPYTELRVHPRKGFGRPGWLRCRDFCHGMVTGWGAHHVDIAQWGLGLDRSGPVAIEATAKFASEGVWDVHIDFDIHYTYANGVTFNFAGNNKHAQGVKFIGSEGWVHVRRGAIAASAPALLKTQFKPSEIHLYESRSHKGNFRDCVEPP